MKWKGKKNVEKRYQLRSVYVEEAFTESQVEANVDS